MLLLEGVSAGRRRRAGDLGRTPTLDALLQKMDSDARLGLPETIPRTLDKYQVLEGAFEWLEPEERPAGGMYGVLLTGLFQADQTGSVFSFLRHALRPPELVQNDTRK